MAATTYLTASSRPEIAFEKVIQHMRAAARSGSPNNDYPLFTLVQASTWNIGRFKWGQAVVYAADTSCIESSTTTYTVIFHPDVNPDDSSLRDCTDKEIKWGPEDDPDPLVTMATCSPIERPHRLSQRADPTTYEHALLLPNAEHRIESAMSEMRALKTNEVLEWGRLLAGVDALKTKFVFKLKFLPTGEVDKYKARLVAKGFLQRYGIDFLETYSPVFQIVFLRCVLAVSLHLGLDLYHVDVKTAFLNSPLKFFIWIEMPTGFANEDGMTHAKLNKSLYSLKQAGRDWYQCQDDFILAYDKRFQRSAVEPCLYFIVSKEITILILVHVDDYVIASNSPAYRDSYLDAFEAKYPCERLGKLSTILQMGVTWASNSVSLSQIKELAAQNGETNSNPILSPMDPVLHLAPAERADPSLPFRSLLGSLMWISRCTRPDICFAVTYLSHFCTTFSHVHFAALKRILRYLFHTRAQTLTLSGLPSSGPVQVRLLTDSDWGQCKSSRRSVSGNLVTIGSSPVSWQSNRQHTVALSTCKAEYIATGDGAKEGLYVVSFLTQFVKVLRPSPLFYDNRGAGYLANDEINNHRSKHIDIRFHFIRSWVKAGIFVLVPVASADNLSDIFTKQLKLPDFNRLQLAIMSAPPAPLGSYCRGLGRCEPAPHGDGVGPAPRMQAG
jgi:hypothetical protein